MTFVFLGGGRIVTALLEGLRSAKYRGRIVVHDRNSHKLAQLRRRFRVEVEPDLQRAVARAGILVIAVRPQSVAELLASIRHVKRATTALSLAAGIPIQTLRRLCGRSVQWARAMPSPAARTCRGLTALVIPDRYPRTAARAIENLFEAVGEVVHIQDREIDAFTVTYSSTHGQHALQTLSAAAQRVGLNSKIALTAAAHALGDSIASWREGDVSLQELLHEAATPGGIAAECMAAMDRQGYSQIVEKSLRAGVARARSFSGARRRN